MYDGVFLINSALSVKKLSVFNNEERFQQTLETLDSIDKHCPNNFKILFDSSPEMPNEEYLKELRRKGVFLFYRGQDKVVNTYSNHGMRSHAETVTFIKLLEWFKQEGPKAKRIYKLSGRYKLTDDFVLDAPEYKDAFVFAEALGTWMPVERQKHAGVDNLYRLRFWHMDYSLLDDFYKVLDLVLQDVIRYGIDIEHAYYKNIHDKYKIVEVKKIGVEGVMAPNGVYINE